MAMPKTTETRYRDGSVQARQVTQDYTSNTISTSFYCSVGFIMWFLEKAM